MKSLRRKRFPNAFGFAAGTMPSSVDTLTVGLAFDSEHAVHVGRVGRDGRIILLEYDESFVGSRLRLSPLLEPTSELVRAKNARLFHGLPGVLADSLPDAWGEELLRRRSAERGASPTDLTGLDRLAAIGSRGAGALTYKPEFPRSQDDDQRLDLDAIAQEAFAVVDGRAVVDIEQLYRLAGSSGGARPKIRITIDPSGRIAGGDLSTATADAWLVKFRGPNDPRDIGLFECAYADMAREAGLDVAETRVLPASRGPGYFATRRFDRLPDGGRIHVASVAGILDVDWTEPSIAYDQLLALTRKISSQSDVERMFRRMVFNVAAHNRDDHTKQHAFLMDRTGTWRLAPAYDLTFSHGPGGEHYLGVDGRGREIGVDHMLRLAENNMIDKNRAVAIVAEVREAVAQFPKFAKHYGVSLATRKLARAIPLL